MRSRARIGALVASCFAALAFGCVGSTGGDLVAFDATASGPSDAFAGQPYAFSTGLGYDVTLTKAVLHVGGLYLNAARPISGEQATSCVDSGMYVGEVTDGIDVDVLSPEPQPFPVKGEGTATPAVVGEVWLSHGDVNAPDDAEPVLVIEGTATKDGATFPFEGSITIGQNRVPPVADPAIPSQHPVCKERIVAPIGLAITPKDGGSLRLIVDPKAFFKNVDFSRLEQVSTSPPIYRFVDESAGQPNINLYNHLHDDFGAYTFVWSDRAD
jgi:hypothetical protein